jgi:hypothetical protein
MAEHHARQRLDLEVAQRRALGLGEAAHLLLREGDVGDLAGRELGEAGSISRSVRR